MQIRILEARGIYKEGQEVDLTTAHAEQWVNSGFAEFVVQERPAKKPAEKKPVAKKVEPKKVAPKKVAVEVTEDDLSS